MNSQETAAAYIGAFVDEWVRAGVTQAVICPGSRSTPLAMAMAEHPQMRVWMHIDERSAGYFALGMAKALRSPIALVCSSGTAAANFFPAVVEACQDRVPLLVLTADRPHELRDVGAPQAIDQIGLYGKYAKWFAEMALPESSPHMLRYARTMASRAAATAGAGPCGPVHLNFPLREPLVPHVSAETWISGLRSAAEGPFVAVKQGLRQLPPQLVRQMAVELSSYQKGLIVVGPYADPALADPVTRLAAALHFPILADPLSQLRAGSHAKEWIIDSYDAFLRDEQFITEYSPDLILRIGVMPTSKALLLYLQHYPDCRQVIVEADSGWREPTLQASDLIYADPAALCQALTEALTVQSFQSAADRWGEKWRGINEQTRAELRKQVNIIEAEAGGLFEGQVFLELAESLPENSALFVGNSMPVRDLDTFFPVINRRVQLFANRGANGIDGIVSSALGVSTACQPLVLVIGDLSFFHDLNGLLAAKLHRLNVTIILINNNGGGIFSFLPQAAYPNHFETLFGTPTDLDFSHVVEMYGGSFEQIHSWAEFRQALTDSLSKGGLSVIEVPTDRLANVAHHRRIWPAVSSAIAGIEKQVQN
ncbi:MAG: 2-succinyl-5-enolpyruvyl-6-hydroxy-3-cyclohexene-carboxylic-acid synthase [Bacilli bacterium]|nr:2-succinyl-5-enolpyruvyl-6-hydroxy-3-cyclohexene-carboxylic-acid synthase [Bacilli bacterium]